MNEQHYLYTDGGARGNPGPAGIGFVIYGPEGETLAEGRDYIGETTNNVAEYQALLAGLECALELGITDLEVRMDSELVVNHLKGIYRVRNDGLKDLYQTALVMAADFSGISFNHIPRKENRRADMLVNKALDEAGK